MSRSHPRCWWILLLIAVSLAWQAPVSADTSTSPLPDLVISSIVFNPPSPYQGQSLSAQVTIKNQGSAQAIFRAGSRVLAATPFGEDCRATADFLLQPNESKTYTVNLLPWQNASPSGTVQVQFTVDPDNKVAETNKGNNTLGQQVTFRQPTAPAPALKIDSLQVSPTTVNPNSQLNFTVNVKNVGTAAVNLKYVRYSIAPSNGANSLYLTNDTPLPVSIAPGQTFQYRGRHLPSYGALPAGLQIFTVEIGSDPFVNGDARNVQVQVVDPAIGSTGLPALVVKEMSASANSVDFGEEVSIYCKIANNGDGPAFFPLGSAFYNFRDNGKVVAVMNVVRDWTVMTGQIDSRTQIFPNLPPGTHTLTLTLDPDNVVKEKDESKHQATVTVTVRGPDLAVTSVKATPQDPSTVTSISLDVTVKNLGPTKWTFAVGAPFLAYGANGYRRYQLPAPGNIELAPGQEYTTKLTLAPFAQSAGGYIISVGVLMPSDPNMANNTFSLPVQVRLPNVKDYTDVKPDGPSGPSGAAPDKLKNPPDMANPNIPVPQPGPSVPGR